MEAQEVIQRPRMPTPAPTRMGRRDLPLVQIVLIHQRHPP